MYSDYSKKFMQLFSDVGEAPYLDGVDRTIPDTLWHYTSISALKSIIETKTLRLGHIRFMNDGAEFEYGSRILREISIEDFSGSSEFFSLFQDILTMSTSADVPVATPFIASFCSKHDSLPHWQSYASGGRGVAIGFKREAFSKVPGFGILPVMYGESNFKRAVRSIIEKIADFCGDAKNNLDGGDYNLLLIDISVMFDAMCMTLKHNALEFENEFRLCNTDYYKKVNLCFTENSGIIKPHILYNFNDISDAVDRIFVGPVGPQSLAYDGIKCFLDFKGLRTTKVEKFETPFRF
ncbi:MAG: DUF2971 domain-containing protein [Niveispirillum sp.]|uniref:DUF2971 domain-containing protein n=1 Tax=Niveispirillum sp. TaxID=1917217 RepID=UPI003BA71E3E